MSNRQRAADRVGAPAFGGPQSSRGRMIASVTGDPAPPPATVVPTADVSFNPDNPREELGDVSDLVESFTEVGQIVAITIATTEAYLSNRPDRRGDLDEGAKYVVIDGNRRLKAARDAGLPTIKIMLGDEFASTDETLLEAAFIANAKRKDLSELEEAQALQRLVTFYGSQHKAAKRLGMSQPLISQKLSLLALTPELQADLEAGRRNVSHLRNMTKVPPQEQRQEADRRVRADAAKKAQRASRQTAPPSATDNSVISPTSQSPLETTEPPSDNSVITPETGASTRNSAPHLPWQDPKALDRLLREHMTEEDRIALAKLLAE
ncbi:MULTISPECIES: ParB/RepB/Spo0J family partition protein [unclassified Streptomyces]|uniref:ParB/RepB/Spo0J family partition protein n=1 Tax=unclassified Streptomyces TaxID=2593676 RepID=UPI00190ABB9E|nr:MULTISPECIES: ParB/RepB/Spo0J family partition protein [unclassified Streptomyces]MBK3603251.1 ParB/RepB/Spo0J family partition protein [Streptomyces sp. MBT54]MBK3643944.1 ParB/RepB/Spo0J family partition protein [Streptomyces sp. MBT33]